MSILTNGLQMALLILVVLLIFNVIIFVHELGHFLAGKWRGLYIDRFQIWFGKPIWKKTIGGVQYGLGWIPAGGFVSLPQMASMEAIEGSNDEKAKALPPVSAVDKAIVAVAGPLFSMLLALAVAVVVWQVGKPKDMLPTTQVGYVEPGSPAEKAGFLPGDKIRAINGKEVIGFAGNLDAVTESVVLSRGKTIRFEIERPGEAGVRTLFSKFETEDPKSFFKRKGVRQVGLGHSYPAVVGKVMENSPAMRAGLLAEDVIVSVDGNQLYSPEQLSLYAKTQDWATMTLGVKSGEQAVREITVTPERPVSPEGRDPMLGILWGGDIGADMRIVHPGPFAQVGDSVKNMWVTISSVAAKDSNIRIEHLSGPVGIGSLLYDLLLTEHGWRRILAFVVLFNVNLAILNMLPFPVLDGGHIVLAFLEKIFGRPVKAKPLEIIQIGCALALMSLMLYVTTKDIGDRFGPGGKSNPEAGPIIFADE